MSVPKNYRQVLNEYEACPEYIQKYFEVFPDLIEFPYEVSIGYLFSRIERAHKMAFYVCIVRRYKLDPATTRKIVINQRMERPRFKNFFEKIFGCEMPADALKELGEADQVRNNILHGDDFTDNDARKAIACILKYAQLFNSFVNKIEGFKPLDTLSGTLPNRAPLIEEPATLLALKGMGFK